MKGIPKCNSSPFPHWVNCSINVWDVCLGTKRQDCIARMMLLELNLSFNRSLYRKLHAQDQDPRMMIIKVKVFKGKSIEFLYGDKCCFWVERYDWFRNTWICEGDQPLSTSYLIRSKYVILSRCRLSCISWYAFCLACVSSWRLASFLRSASDAPSSSDSACWCWTLGFSAWSSFHESSLSFLQQCKSIILHFHNNKIRNYEVL